MTPLHYAAQNNQNGAKTSEHLLNKASYALINWQDHKGRTALHLGYDSEQKSDPARYISEPGPAGVNSEVHKINFLEMNKSDKRIK